MRYATILAMSTLWISAIASADAIDYRRIPADARGYAHLDFDRFLSSSLCQQWSDAKSQASQLNSIFGEHADVTLYSGVSGDVVMVLRTPDADFRRRLALRVSAAPQALLFSYATHAVRYAAEGWNKLFAPEMAVGTGFAPAPPKEMTGKSPPTFSLDLGRHDGSQGVIFNKGPLYVAFIGPDLIVVAGDLPSMANAIDVIDGTKPSLANNDPQGLKMDFPAGVFFLGAGVTAPFRNDNSAAGDSVGAGQADDAVHSYGFDLFGSVRGKATLARFDFGEDGRSIYADGSVVMKDAESAGQLNNLIAGVKALASLSQADVRALLDPVTVGSDGTKVLLHWSWPTSRIPELVRLVEAQSQHDASPLPTTTRSAQPTH